MCLSHCAVNYKLLYINAKIILDINGKLFSIKYITN